MDHTAHACSVLVFKHGDRSRWHMKLMLSHNMLSCGIYVSSVLDSGALSKIPWHHLTLERIIAKVQLPLFDNFVSTCFQNDATLRCVMLNPSHLSSAPKSPRGVFKFLDLSPDSSTWGEGQPSRKKVRMPCNWMPCKQHSMEYGIQASRILKQKDLTFFAAQQDTLLHLHWLGCSVDLPYGCLVVPFFGFERPKWKLDKDELQPHTIQGSPYPSTVHVLS